MLQAGKPVDTTFSELMCKTRDWDGARTRIKAPGIVLGPSAERSMQAVFSTESNSFKRVSNTRSGNIKTNPTHLTLNSSRRGGSFSFLNCFKNDCFFTVLGTKD